MSAVFKKAKEVDWRLESSSAALAAFAAEVGKLEPDPRFGETGRNLATRPNLSESRPT